MSIEKIKQRLIRDSIKDSKWLEEAKRSQDKKLVELPFTVRTLNSFKMAGFTHESDLVNLTEQDLLILKFGKKTIIEVKEYFKASKQVTLGDIKEIVRLFEGCPDDLVIKKAFGIKLIKC
jgi:DNA-directed RNA polymerase alpha subunit